MMRLLLALLLLCLVQEFVVGRNVVKRQCGSNCNGNNCCSSNTCNSNNCNNNCPYNKCNNCQSNCNNNNCQSNCNNNNCQSNCNNNNCQKCNDNDEHIEPREPVLVPFPIPPSNYPSNGGTNNTNLNSYNFTADITLTNVINTVNNISIPITLNNTNINKVIIQEDSNSTTGSRGESDNCCIVVYPRTCNEPGCTVRRERVCSPICNGHVVPAPPIPQAPLYPTSPCGPQPGIPWFPRTPCGPIPGQWPVINQPPIYQPPRIIYQPQQPLLPTGGCGNGYQFPWCGGGQPSCQGCTYGGACPSPCRGGYGIAQ